MRDLCASYEAPALCQRFFQSFVPAQALQKEAFVSFLGLVKRNFLPTVSFFAMDVSASHFSPDLLQGFLLKVCIETGDVKAALASFLWLIPFMIVPDEAQLGSHLRSLRGSS